MADYLPQLSVGGVSHYYGNQVRQLFIAAAALILIGAPFYADSLRSELPFEIAGALVLVALAAVANPHNKSIFFMSAIVAGTGLAIYETWALNWYFESTWVQFVLREVIAVLFLVAFYFNVKTVRAFLLGKIGHHDEVGEFDEPSSSGKPMQKKTVIDEFLPWVHRNGDTKQKKPPEETGPRMSPGRTIDEVMPKSHPYEERL